METSNAVAVGQRRRWNDTKPSDGEGDTFTVVEVRDDRAWYRYGDMRAVFSRRLGEVETQSAPAPSSPLSQGVRDWSRWLPPRETPNTGVATKVFMRGQVWAFHAGLFAAVVRIEDPSDRAQPLLAISTGRNPEMPMAFAVGGNHRLTAVLVQDVDQPEPTPPEVLYGPRPATAAPAATEGAAQCESMSDYSKQQCHKRLGHSGLHDDSRTQWFNTIGDDNATNAQAPALPSIRREAPPLREVSNEGRTWVPYESVSRVAGGFEAWPWRRVNGDIVAWPKEPRGYGGKTWAEHVYEDYQTSVTLRSLEGCIARYAAPAAAPVGPVVQARTGGFVGVWRLR